MQADRTVHANTIAPRSVKADKLSVQDLSAIADGTIDSAKIADTIQSAPFEPGRRGWWIERDGRAEFNDVVISRQLQVDSVSLGLAALQVPRTAQPAITVSWIVATSADLRLGRRTQHLSRHGRPRQRLRHCQRGRPARCPLRRSGHHPAAHHLERTPGAAPETRPVDPEGHRRPSDDGRDLADRLEALPGHLTASPGARSRAETAPKTDRFYRPKCP